MLLYYITVQFHYHVPVYAARQYMFPETLVLNAIASFQFLKHGDFFRFTLNPGPASSSLMPSR